jgi:hypothetical protein
MQGLDGTMPAIFVLCSSSPEQHCPRADNLLIGSSYLNVNVYDMIYLLTAIGLTPGGSRIVHIYTQTVHRTTQ